MFHNNLFPRELAALTPKTSWRTIIVESGGGQEQRSGIWSDARRRYDASNNTLTLEQFRQIEEHFNARRGRLFSFPLRDRSFYSITQEPLGTGGGVASTNQLTVNRGDTGNAYNQEIYLPDPGTIHIFANTVEKTEGVHWTLDYATATGGRVTWLSSVSGQTLTWTGQFLQPVRYDIDEFPDAKMFKWTDGGVNLVSGPEIPLLEVRFLSEW
jgi:uncharacterized protein (TIGR02217 family)